MEYIFKYKPTGALLKTSDEKTAALHRMNEMLEEVVEGAVDAKETTVSEDYPDVVVTEPEEPETEKKPAKKSK